MKRILAGLAAAIACLCAAPALAAGCTTATTPNTSGVTANAQYEQLGNICDAVQPYAAKVSASVTRPANTTQYSANTALANATSGATYSIFTNVCRANGAGVLIPEILVIDYANQATKLQGVLWLFNAAPTAINDAATFSIAAADLAKLVASVPFTLNQVANQGSGASGMVVADLTGAGIEAVCAAGDRNLYGLWQVVNTYTPVSAEVLTGVLKVTGIN